MASSFDPLRPPDPDLLADCVHCGFCLPACPTYQLWGEEMDSPRGRILLMDLASKGEVDVSDTFVRHIDACLGCMACVTACPSGVQYGPLLEATRAQVERIADRPAADRWLRRGLFWLFPHRRRVRAAAAVGWLYRVSGLAALLRRSGLVARLPARLQALEGLLPDLRARDLTARLPASTRPEGPPRLRVALLDGCVQSVFFSAVNAAAVRVLVALGCEVLVPPEAGCCGALELHTGAELAARHRARRLIAALEGADRVVVTAAGCGSTMKEYGHLLRDDDRWAERAAALAARTVDVTELIAELGLPGDLQPVPQRVAYHDACHLAHAQGIRAQPREVLAALPGVQVLEIADADLCCGSAGVYNLLQPEAAADLGARKAAAVRAVAPDVVASGNPGCLLQLRRHLGPDGPRVVHPVELVDAALHRPARMRAGGDATAPDGA